VVEKDRIDVCNRQRKRIYPRKQGKKIVRRKGKIVVYNKRYNKENKEQGSGSG
jgi:ribosomal protein L36